MSLTKDGFYKSFSGAIGNNNYLLEAGGGHIGWGNAANQIPYSNGILNTSLNADMTDGLHVHTGRNNEANKIVRTDGNGYIQTGWINTTSGDMGSTVFSRIYVSNDAYIRYVSVAQFKTGLFGGQVGSPSVPIYWTGSAFATCIVSFGNQSYGEHDANNINDNGIKYYTSNGPSTSLGATTSDGALYSQAYSTSWVAQIAQDYRNGGLYVRGKNNGTWQSWYRVWDNRTTYVSGGKGYIGGTEITQVNNADTVDSMHANEFVPKRHSARFYPFVNSSYGQPWYKITLPWAGYTSGSNAWMMTTMEIVLGGSYSSGNNGRIYLQYYFVKNTSNVWTASDVRGTCIGYRLIENGVTIKYDIANPGIFYIKANANTYNSIGLENITANDTAPNFDFRNTTIEAIAESSVPSAVNQTVPLYHTITTQNGYWANLNIQTTPLTNTIPQLGGLYVINDSSNNGYDGLGYFRAYTSNDWGLIVDKSNSYTYGVDIRSGGAYALRVGNGNTRLIGSTVIGADDAPSYTLDVRGTTRSTGRIYANEWIQFDSYTGIYSPNNSAHFYPNNSTSYGQWLMQGARGGYSGIQFGTNTGYMTIMDNQDDKGLYEQDWNWILYFNRRNKNLSLRSSSSLGYNINLYGSVGTDSHMYSYGFHHLSHNNDDAVLLAGGGWEYKSNYYRNLGGGNYITITVGGDANTYYPVVIDSPSDYYPYQFVNITRIYNETAPDTWNTSTHKGGLSMAIFWNGSRYWDGNASGGEAFVVRLYESYCTMVGGVDNSTSGKVVWLRGGGANYHIFSINGRSQSATVYLSTYTDSASRSFAPRTTPVTPTVQWPGDIQNGAGYLRDRSNGTATYTNYGAAGLGLGSITWLTCWNGYELRAISKGELGGLANVYQHTTNNVDYPLVWSNQNNTSTVQANQLHKSYADLVYNPANKEIKTWSFAPQGESSNRGIHFPGGAWINSISTSIIFRNATIRFGGSGWDWNAWAGLNFDGNTTINIGMPNNSHWTANSNKTAGTIRTVSSKIEIFPDDNSNYGEGLRIHSASNGWTSLIFCGTDNTGFNGTSANSWSLHTLSGNFYLNKNNSSTAAAPRLWGHGNGYTFGSTSRSSANVTVTSWLEVTGATSGTMSYSTTNPRITFSENGIQAVGIVYTDWDSYRASKGLKVMDVDNSDTGNVWLEVQGSIYGNTVYANLAGSSTAGGISLYSTSNPISEYGIAFRGTGSYGRLQGIQSDWATYFTMNDDTSRGWMFRRGSTNVLAIDGFGSLNRFYIYRLRLPDATAKPVGWYQMCRVSGLDGYFNFNLLMTGGWNSGAPTMALLNIACYHTTPVLTQICGKNNGVITKIRLRNISGGDYYLDVYQAFGYTSSTSMSDQYFLINGSVRVTEIAEPTAVTSATGGTELSIQDISGHLVNRENAYWANLQVQTSSRTDTSPTVSTIYASNWFRSTGATGWYSESYGGGIWMTDSSWIRTYGSKNFYVEGGNFAVSGNAGIGRTSMSYRLDVQGDSYTRGWARADNGFYIEGQGVHYTHLGSYGEIYLSSNNVLNFTTGSWSTLYFNYGGSGKYGNTWVSNYVWHAGSTSTYADHNIGKLHVRPTSGNYSWNEGIRIHAASNGWTTLILCGTDNTGDSGTSANSWSLHAYGGNFYLSKNGSTGGTSYMDNISNKWYFNTTSGGEAVNVGGWINTVGACGWYNSTYGGGMWMNDSNYVRVYNGKYLYTTYIYYDVGNADYTIDHIYASNDRYIRPMAISTFLNKLWWANLHVSTSSNTWTEPTLGRIYVQPHQGSWVSGMTTNPSIWYNNGNAIDANSYWAFLGMKSSSSHVINFGGLGNNIGFYGYYSGRTDNGYDWYFTVNMTNGVWTASKDLYSDSHMYSYGFHHRSYNSSAYLLRSDGSVAAFNWSGQPGQPTWLWGGNSFNTYYVYNPYNFDVNSAAKLRITGYQSDGLSFYQTDSSFDGSPSSSWAHYIIANHGNGASYYHYTIRLPFWGPPQYRRQEGSTSNVTQWYTFLTTENGYWANQPLQTSSSTSTNPQFNSVNIGGTNTNYGAYLASGKRLYIEGTESNAIYTEHHANSHISTNSPESNAAIRHGFVFKWYDTYWKIGNVRGGSTNSAGFGIGYYGGSQLSLLVKPDLCGTNIYGKTANSDSNAALRVIKGWDCGNRAGYDTVVISSNDCTSLRLIEADGTCTGISAGDYKSILATTHNFQFYSGCSNTGTIYNGMGGTFRFGINYSNFDAWVQRGLRVNASGSSWTHDPSSSNSGVCIFADSQSMNTYVQMKPYSNNYLWGLATYYEGGGFGYNSNLLVYQAPTSGTNAVNNCYIFRGIGYGGQGQSYVATCEGNSYNLVVIGVFTLTRNSPGNTTYSPSQVHGLIQPYIVNQVRNEWLGSHHTSDGGMIIRMDMRDGYQNYTTKTTINIVSAYGVITETWWGRKYVGLSREDVDAFCGSLGSFDIAIFASQPSQFTNNDYNYSQTNGVNTTGRYLMITNRTIAGWSSNGGIGRMSFAGLYGNRDGACITFKVTCFGYLS